MIRIILLIFALAFAGAAYADGASSISTSTRQILNALGLFPDTEKPVLHAHASARVSAHEAAEKDAAVALIYALQCDAEKTQWYLARAYEHDSENPFVQKAHLDAVYYFQRTRAEAEFLAKENEDRADALSTFRSTDIITDITLTGRFLSLARLLLLNEAKQLYRQALLCDPHRASAQEGYARVWQKQHGSWTFANRLGYLP